MNAYHSAEKTTEKLFGGALFLSAPQIAKELRIDKHIIYRSLESDGVPYVKIGKQKRYAYDDIRLWLAQKWQTD